MRNDLLGAALVLLAALVALPCLGNPSREDVVVLNFSLFKEEVESALSRETLHPNENDGKHRYDELLAISTALDGIKEDHEGEYSPVYILLPSKHDFSELDDAGKGEEVVYEALRTKCSVIYRNTNEDFLGYSDGVFYLRKGCPKGDFLADVMHIAIEGSISNDVTSDAVILGERDLEILSKLSMLNCGKFTEDSWVNDHRQAMIDKEEYGSFLAPSFGSSIRIIAGLRDPSQPLVLLTSFPGSYGPVGVYVPENEEKILITKVLDLLQENRIDVSLALKFDCLNCKNNVNKEISEYEIKIRFAKIQPENRSLGKSEWLVIRRSLFEDGLLYLRGDISASSLLASSLVVDIEKSGPFRVLDPVTLALATGIVVDFETASRDEALTRWVLAIPLVERKLYSVISSNDWDLVRFPVDESTISLRREVIRELREFSESRQVMECVGWRVEALAELKCSKKDKKVTRATFGEYRAFIKTITQELSALYPRVVFKGCEFPETGRFIPDKLQVEIRTISKAGAYLLDNYSGVEMNNGILGWQNFPK